MTDIKIKKALPFEILEQIFDQISYTNQLTCQSVCKAWSRAAVECVNKSLQIYGPSGVHLLASKLVGSTENAMEYTGASVKKIKISDRAMDKANNTRLQGGTFVQLLQACLNLEEIVLAPPMFLTI